MLGVDSAEAIENKLNQLAVETARWSEDNAEAIKTAYVEKGSEKISFVLKENSDQVLS